jgi:hypothetical protein
MLLVSLSILTAAASAQAQPRAYVGGAMAAVTESPDDLYPGGARWAGSFVFGVPLSSRLSIEFEPTFVAAFQGEYTYSPMPFRQARVVTRRRDTFATLQLRAKTGPLEPIVGIGAVARTAHRRATFIQTGNLYFDDQRSRTALGVAAGIDAAIRLTSRVTFVPTFRAFVVTGAKSSFPETDGGRVAIRYGAGARVGF